MAPFPRGTLRPARPPALRAPLDSRRPRSGGLRRRYDEPLAAAPASRRPTDRHRPPPLLHSPGPVGALGGTNGGGQRRRDWPSALGPCRFPGRCRRRDLGGRCPGAAPFSRTGARRSWLWQLPSPRAWSRQHSAQPRATGTAGSSDRDRRTLRPRPQSARSGVVGQFEIMDACLTSCLQGPGKVTLLPGIAAVSVGVGRTDSDLWRHFGNGRFVPLAKVATPMHGVPECAPPNRRTGAPTPADQQQGNGTEDPIALPLELNATGFPRFLKL